MAGQRQQEAVRTAVDGQTLIVALRPSQANAIDVATSRSLFAALDQLRSDPRSR